MRVSDLIGRIKTGNFRPGTFNYKGTGKLNPGSDSTGFY
jgi:hypothetical protein